MLYRNTDTLFDIPPRAVVRPCYHNASREDRHHDYRSCDVRTPGTVSS